MDLNVILLPLLMLTVLASTSDLAGDKFSSSHLSSFCMIGCSYGKSLDCNSSAVCGLYILLLLLDFTTQ